MELSGKNDRMNFVYFYDKTAKKGYNFVVSIQHP